ncbi:MAG TPA: hypothetical protein VGR68_01385, partial [Actinomycetota bacterium]|nr:hypothetical protein [Actinomycetota bacterium]
MNRADKSTGIGVVLALVALAVLASRASPGFPLGEVPQSVGRSIARALGVAAGASGGERSAGRRGASAFAVADIPRGYYDLYVEAASTCRGLSWQLLAAIGKVESDHGRSPAPGVRSGINRAGCCAGPMQFNLTNGPP